MADMTVWAASTSCLKSFLRIFMFVVKIDDIAVRIRSIATSNGNRCKLPTKTNKEIITGLAEVPRTVQ